MRLAVTGVLIAALVAPMVGPAVAQPAPDVERAKELYLAAESAARDGRFADAIRDYGAAFDITRDPVLFYKIGSANERAGKCDIALIYYQRYIKEGRPSEKFYELTRERIVACGGDPRSIPHPSGAAPADTSPTPPADGAPGAEPGAEPGAPASPTPPAASGGEDASAAGTAGPAAPAEGPRPTVLRAGRDRAAWLLVGGSIGLLTIGGVLAYSAGSAENDIADLYVGFGGQPPAFDDRTRRTYEGLIDEGNRYEKLSWVSFGLAGATGIAAAILFWRGANDERVQLAPSVSTEGAGVRATLRF